MTQLDLLGPQCKRARCEEPVVGSSITGEGHVCKRHNEEEWGKALSRSKEPHYRSLGRALLNDAQKAV